MSTDLEIHLIAYDEASSVLESVGATMTTTFQNIEGQTQTLASTTEAATSQISLDYDDVQFSMNALNEAQGNAQASFGNSVMAMNNLALAGAGLVMSFERIENAQVMVDRANLMVQRSTENAERAQTTYNEAVAKFGPNSTQAKEALDKLNIAQEALRVAQERADMSSRNYNNTMLTAALTVIPSLISIIGTVSHAQEIWTGIQWALNAAMSANPIGIIILAIAGLVAIIITAYETCKPFRDIINGIGEAFSGFFLTTINAVKGALEWLWNNVFVPFGNFMKAVFGPIISFLTELFNSFYNIIKPIVDAVTAVANIMGGFVGTIVGALGGARDAIGGFISSICFAHAFQRAADESAGTMDTWQGMVKRNTDKALDSIKAFNADVGISAVPNVNAVIAGAPLSLPAAKPSVNIMITAPLVNIAGSADRATAQLAANMVKEQLQNVIIQPTSPSNLLRKQVRIAR